MQVVEQGVLDGVVVEQGVLDGVVVGLSVDSSGVQTPR